MAEEQFVNRSESESRAVGNREVMEFSPYDYSEGLENSVITEEDIFKYLVDNDDQSKSILRNNIKHFFSRVPVNIYRDEYYILYKVLEQANKYGTFFSVEDVYHVLQNTGEDLLHDSNIKIHNTLEPTERLEAVFTTVLQTYDMLLEEDLEEDSNRLLVTIENYMDTYVRNGLEILTRKEASMLDGSITKRNGLRYTLQEIRAYRDKMERMLYGLLEDDLERLSPVIDTSIMGVEEIMEIINDEESSEVVVMTGVDALDNIIGGIKKSQYMAIQAGSGIGKTKFGTVNMVHNAIINGKNVLVDSIELTSKELFMRLVVRHIAFLHDSNSIVSGLGERKVIESGVLTAEEERYVSNAIVDLITNTSYGNFKITDEQVEVEGFTQRLESYWDKGFHFDLYVLDYIGIVASSRGLDKHKRVTEISNTLKMLVKNFKGRGFAAIVISQISKDAERELENGDLEAGKYGTSESADVRRDCDLLLTLHQDSEMKEANQMKLIIDKARYNGLENGNIFDCIADKDKNVFISLD